VKNEPLDLPQSRRQDILSVGLIALAYFAANEISFLYPDADRVLMTIWPAAGIGLAALLIFPRRLWPSIITAIFVAGNTANLFSGRPFVNSIGYMTANILESLGSAWLIIAWCGRDVRFTRMIEVLALLCSAIIVAPLAGLIGAGTASLTGAAPFSRFLETWTVSDGLGILLVTPLIISWRSGIASLLRLGWMKWIEAGVFFLVWCSLAWLLFSTRTNETLPDVQPYMVFVLLAWVAFRFEQRGVALALVSLAFIAVTSPAVSTGPLIWGGGTIAERLFHVEIFIGFASATGLLMAATYTERKFAMTAMTENERKFRSLFENMTEGVAIHEMIYDDAKAVDYRILDINPAFETHTGLPRSQARGLLASSLYGTGTPPYFDEYAAVALTGTPHTFDTYFPPLDRYFHISVFSPSKGMFATVFEDISDRKRKEKELQEKNAELERFTYTVSHDLKSPLITIKGFSGGLLKDLSNGRYDRFESDLNRIADAANKMHGLLEDLLELSRVGRIVNPPSDIAFETMAHEIVGLLHGPITNGNVTVVVQKGLPTIHADKRRLAEVLQNLIENSLKFMGDQPEPLIEIGMKKGEGEPVFFVRDNGEGIDPKYRETIFGLFNKLDAATEGTGIGLALARRIIEVHGGRIWVESDGAKRGATFYFTIPSTKIIRKGEKK
jgi:signal transduction histidine kinase/integral membrane sensor domain MASE1